MKKSYLLWLLFLLNFAFNVSPAVALPDIRGEYSGTQATVVSNCPDSGTYNAVLAMSFPTQTENLFSGIATATYTLGNVSAVEYIQFSGTITESGQIKGFSASPESGTITKVGPDSISISANGETFIFNVTAAPRLPTRL